MINNKRHLRYLTVLITCLSLNACSVFDWLVYKPDLSQGNYIEQQQVDKLRINMNKAQVEYILGRPVLRDSFANDTWYYIYHFKNGRNAKITHKELILHFHSDKLMRVTGNYQLSKNFNTSLEQSTLAEIRN